MRIWILILMNFASLACSNNKDSRYIDERAREFFNEFQAEHGYDISFINIRFSVFEEAEAAKCVKESGLVLVNEVYWADWCDEQKRSVIWHELGHCVLGRKHEEDGSSSYMVSDVQKCEWYLDKEEELFEEMFIQ